jgi:general secretion pathway protein K
MSVNHRPAPAAGFALMLVLSILILLGLLGNSFSLAVRQEIQQTAWLTQQTRQIAVAQVGITHALWYLAHPDAAQRWQPDGQPQRISWDGHDITLRIRSEQSKIDLNRAPRDLLQGLLQRVLPTQPAGQLADAILDWRDTDQLTRQSTTEVSQYAPAIPGNRPFFSVAELAHVAGFTAEHVTALTPFLTVHSRRARIDPRSAALPVIAALPGLPPGQAEQFVQQRQRALASGQRLDFSLLSPAQHLIDTSPQRTLFAMQIQVSPLTDYAYQIETVVQRLRHRPGYQIVYWHDML